jgi:hypothetical protein
MARWGERQLQRQQFRRLAREEAKMAAEGSLTAQATLVQTMERLVGIKRLAEEVVKKQETLVMVVVGQTSAWVQRGFLLQVLDAEATGLTEMVRRLLPGPPDAKADEA